jgi:hypothetical protein
LKYEHGTPGYDALQDTSEHIPEGLEERHAARNEAADRASRRLNRWSKMHEEYYRAFNGVCGVGRGDFW